MAVRIRMKRVGTKNAPYFRIVVADSRSPRDGKFLEKVGTYFPMLKESDPGRIVLNEERIKYWLSNGATPSERVGKFLGKAKITAVPENRKSVEKAEASEKREWETNPVIPKVKA